MRNEPTDLRVHRLCRRMRIEFPVLISRRIAETSKSLQISPKRIRNLFGLRLDRKQPNR